MPFFFFFSCRYLCFFFFFFLFFLQFDKEKANERVAALGGGIARIKVKRILARVGMGGGGMVLSFCGGLGPSYENKRNVVLYSCCIKDNAPFLFFLL